MNNIKEQQKNSKKFVKKAKKFHNDLVDKLDDENLVDLKQEPIKDAYETGFGSILEIDQQIGGEPEEKSKTTQSYLDIKNQTLSNLSGKTMGATTIGTGTIGGQTGFTGSIANDTIANFKQKMNDDPIK